MLSIIVSWRDRKELGQALPGLIASSQRLDGDVTIVNFSGDAAMLRGQLGDRAARAPVRVIDVPGQRYFNKSCAHNVGIAHTRHPLLFFCDCDIVLDPDAVAALAEAVLAGDDRFGTVAGVRESETNSRGAGHVVCFGYELRIRTSDGRFLRIVDNEEDAADGTRQAPGLLMARRSHLESISGYNSRLIGWGWEDQDMISRLTLGAGLERVQHGQVIHISHDDAARVAHYPIANRWESRDRMFRQALSNYDRGDFSGTLHDDNQRVHAHPWPA